MNTNLRAIRKQLWQLLNLLDGIGGVKLQAKHLFVRTINDNISKSRKNNPLALQLANELAGTMLIIEDQKLVIKELYDELNNTARYYFDIDAILEHDRNLYDGQRKLNVRKSDEENFFPVAFNPKDIICIISDWEGKRKDGRKKVIYERKIRKGEPTEISKYYLNTPKLQYGENEVKLNFETLKKYIDPLGHYLMSATQSSIINIDCYDFDAENTLLLNFIDDRIDSAEAIKIILPERITDLRWVKSEIVRTRENRYNRQFTHEKAEFYIKSIS